MQYIWVVSLELDPVTHSAIPNSTNSSYYLKYLVVAASIFEDFLIRFLVVCG